MDERWVKEWKKRKMDGWMERIDEKKNGLVEDED